MADLYSNTTPGLTSPAIDGNMIVPSDAADLPHVTRAIYVGTAGEIQAELASGVTVSFISVPAGTMLPLRLRKILSTGTTAGDLVALW
ncbi:spike base protein, RCAP_Rcc01079 family [Meridianimarinicoccus aquatilis]|uniref:Uncharacterized protein n=1 Tax=Meridianimarinicoccus aquatilis TaxID=2552766 RepID=A0A4R6B1Z4_9RHOB|nr:hypothetical protein [Fluviibacterium aquatile]QIE41258.1 hypothetical protein G5B39_04395 [Rhodobacteraceae bacterium SC52]TDL90600.1 hypothetical protein E2L05_04780 [Fluviibacterium aquatile]